MRRLILVLLTLGSLLGCTQEMPPFPIGDGAPINDGSVNDGVHADGGGTSDGIGPPVDGPPGDAMDLDAPDGGLDGGGLDGGDGGVDAVADAPS